MAQTNYVNPNGLPADEQITSARDLAILARALIREFPEYDYYWHIASIRLGKRIYRNTNSLIDAYAGADGMKTGFTCASGFNLVATATRGGKRLIAIVLGAKSRAAMSGRMHVEPDDIQAVVAPVMRHRIGLSFRADVDKMTVEDIIKRLVEMMPAPHMAAA